MPYLNNIMEFLGLLVAIFYYPHLRKSYMKWFLPFLAFVTVCELFLVFGARILFGPNQVANYHNTFLYASMDAINYLIGIVETVFYGYIFYQFSSSKLVHKSIYIQVALSELIYLYGFFFSAHSEAFLLYAVTAEGFLLVIVALLYIYTQYIDNDAIFGTSEPGFWIAIGVTLFFSGTSIVFSLYDLIVENHLKVLGSMLYNFVPRMLCVVLYTCTSIAIILWKKKHASPYGERISTRKG